MTRVVTAPFNGATAAGSVLTVPEAQVGDLVLCVIRTRDGFSVRPQTDPAVVFAVAIIVAGELIQVEAGVSTDTWVAVLERDELKTISLSGTIG